MIRLAFYRGKSLISKLIRWQTFGEYSHVGLLLADESIIEAWHVGGVLHNPALNTVHTTGTEVDIYRVRGISPEQAQLAIDYMKSRVGNEYDFRSVFRFVTRWELLQDKNPDKDFCSEACSNAFKHAQYPLLRADYPSIRVSPTGLSTSPFLELEKTVITQ